MKRSLFAGALAAAMLGCLVLSGCGSSTPTTNGGAGAPNGGHKHEEDDHAHGPRNGQLLELGQEEYHLELMLDDKNNTVTCYTLDKEGKNDVAVDAEDITLKFEIAGSPKEWKLLPASPNAEGKASKFVLVDQELATALEEHETDLKSRIAITIDGKNYEKPFKFHHH